MDPFAFDLPIRTDDNNNVFVKLHCADSDDGSIKSYKRGPMDKSSIVMQLLNACVFF